jgi:hypothetical protein
MKVENATTSQIKTWIEHEVVGREFRGARLSVRFRSLFEQLSDGAYS